MSIAISRKVAALLSFGFIVVVCVVLGRTELPPDAMAIVLPESVALADIPETPTSAAGLFAAPSVVRAEAPPDDAAARDADEPLVPLSGAIARTELPPLHNVQDSSPPAAALDAPTRRPPPFLLLKAEVPRTEVLSAAESGAVSPGAEKAAATVEPARPRETRRTVHKGETLAGICESVYGVCDARTLNAVLSSNAALKRRGGKVLAGEVIELPDLTSAARPASVQQTRSASGGAEREPARRGPGAGAARTAPEKPAKLPKTETRRRSRSG